MILFYIITMIYGSQSLSLQSLDKVVLTPNASVSTNVQKHSYLLTKIKSNPKEFIAEVQTLDPEALQTVITLVEGLIQSSKDKEQELIDDLAVKSAALNEANTNIVNAEESLNNANQAVAEAQVVADAAATHLDNMKEIHVEKMSEKDNSQANHDDEIPGLNDEQEVLTEVLNLLNGLPDGRAGYTKLRLVFTKNHGSSAVCVDNLRLTLDGREVPFPSGTVVTDTGAWSSGYPGKNLLLGASGYYCSESGSCSQNNCNEAVTITMPTPVKFNGYGLTQRDGMGYNPNAFQLQAMESSQWKIISSVTDFNFPSGGATETWWLQGLQSVKKGWTLLYRQTMPFKQDRDLWLNYNQDHPDDPNYSIIDQLERYRSSDGKFEFKLVWPAPLINAVSGELYTKPDLANYNWWKQTSNPFNFKSWARTGDSEAIHKGGVKGYEAIDVQNTARHWGGLEYSCHNEGHCNCLLDGGLWFSNGKREEFYCVGATYDNYSNGNGGRWPGYNGRLSGETQIELWVNYS